MKAKFMLLESRGGEDNESQRGQGAGFELGFEEWVDFNRVEGEGRSGQTSKNLEYA